MDKKELLKSMLHNLINDKPEEASLDFHKYVTPKTREIAGLDIPIEAPVVDDTPGDAAE